MSRLRRQISYRASLSTWFVTSVCSRSECTQSTVLYGSTHAEEICGQDHTVNEILDFVGAAAVATVAMAGAAPAATAVATVAMAVMAAAAM